MLDRQGWERWKGGWEAGGGPAGDVILMSNFTAGELTLYKQAGGVVLNDSA